MLIPSNLLAYYEENSSLSRRVNANSQLLGRKPLEVKQAYQEG